MPRPEWMDWRPDPRETDLEEQGRDYCEQCGRERSELCPACGDEKVVARSVH